MRVMIYFHSDLRRSGVNVPGVRMVDATQGLLGIEWIDGLSVKRLLPSGTEDDEEVQNDGLAEDENPLDAFQISIGMFFPFACISFQADEYIHIQRR